jgi:hypothetical protein
MPNQSMNPLELSAKVRHEADLVMQMVRLSEILRSFGEITFTGSYYLDVMVYPDIDLYIPSVSIEDLFGAGAQLAASDLVTQVIFEKSAIPNLPGGHYLKPRIDYGDWGRPWKIDIWSLDQTVIDCKMAELQRLKAKMSPHLREQIITYKCSIINSQKRTPMYSGYQIYKAFLDEGLTSFQDVTRYLVEHDIVMG